MTAAMRLAAMQRQRLVMRELAALAMVLPDLVPLVLGKA
jgi:hypothetical protein